MQIVKYDSSMRNNKSMKRLLLGMFLDDYVGCMIDENDLDDVDCTIDLLVRNNTVYFLTVDGVYVCVAELYSNKLGKSINIFTHSDHRRKQYGYYLANELIERQLINRWVAASSNTASQEMAVKLGLVRDYTAGNLKEYVYKVNTHATAKAG